MSLSSSTMRGRGHLRHLRQADVHVRGIACRRVHPTTRLRRHHVPAHEHARRPVILAIAGDIWKARELKGALARRYGADYRVRVTSSVRFAEAMLERLRDETHEVAMVVADFRLPGISGVEFLEQAHALHPAAKRGLLATHGDHEAAEPIHRAMALGELEMAIPWPWASPEEFLYPQASEALAAWWRTHRPRFERVRIIGEQWDARSHELRDLGTRNGVPYGFYDANAPAGRHLLRELGAEDAPLPVVTVDGHLLLNPTTIEIANALGATTAAPTDLVDIAIIGAGPAGLTAGVYAASEGLRTVVIEPEAVGGQAGTSSMIRNYLGFPQGVSGEEITRRAHQQALHFGAQVLHTHAATALRSEGDERIITLSNGAEIRTRSVAIATGVSYRRLGIPALERLVGAGVFYGAATAEARAMAGEDVVVVGAGNSAGQAAMHLAQVARRVTLVVRGTSLERSMSSYLIRQIEHAANIEVRLQTEVVDVHGEYRLTGVVLADASGRRFAIGARALFVLIGGHPRTDWLDGILQRDGAGYLLTCRDLAPRYASMIEAWPLVRNPYPLETSMPGVFAIGDVRHNSVKRVASAVGDGAVAVFAVHAYLADLAA
jgi:thioredoxin reductase (NADPH)